MIRNKTVSLIIPCKNEADSIQRLIKQVPNFVDEIIVVDNNSRDKTASVAKRLGAKVISEKRHIHGIGYGFAHQSGLKAAKGDIIVTMDGDNTYPVEQIKEVISYLLKHNLDFITCSRFPLKNHVAISKVRQMGVKILNLEARILYGYPFQDILSGMWVMTKKTKRYLKLSEGGWDLSVEIKLQALKHPQIIFDQYHINHHYRDNGASKQAIWKTGFGHLYYLLSKKMSDTYENFSLDPLFLSTSRG